MIRVGIYLNLVSTEPANRSLVTAEQSRRVRCVNAWRPEGDTAANGVRFVAELLRVRIGAEDFDEGTVFMKLLDGFGSFAVVGFAFAITRVLRPALAKLSDRIPKSLSGGQLMVALPPCAADRAVANGQCACAQGFGAARPRVRCGSVGG